MSIGSGTGPTGNISGCSFWFIADQLTSSGNYVTYWHDLSGSGVNLTYPTSPGSSTTVFPVYIPQVLNGYGCVRFSGGQYLTTNTNTPVLATQTGYLTTFSVYATTGITQQVVYSLDNSVLSTTIGGIIGVTSTGSGNMYVYSAANPIVASSIYTRGNYIIRHDRFDPVTGEFYLGYFGKDVASGNIIASVNHPISNAFNMGYAPNSTYANQKFQGDIVEVIGWTLPLATSDVASVNTYLMNKYFPNPPVPPTNFKLPPDLSGLFCWYRSTSIGVTGVDSSPVQYWPDDSGSGNYLYVPSSQSGTWVFPGFYRNSINGYPIVRFINGAGYSYLQTNINDSNVNLSQNNLSTFAVFTPTDGITEQCVYGIDDGFHNTYLYAGLNHGGYHNSFYSASGPTLGINTVIASSTTFGTTMYQPGTFMIRSDRFSPSTSSTIFGRYAAELSSGYITTYNINSPIFRVGYNSAAGLSFYGDIAEIVGYNRSLSTYETSLVNDYLINKYMPGNVGAFSLLLYGNTPSSTYASKPLFANGSNAYNITSTTLYTGSSLLSNSGTTLYEISIGSINSGTTLYMAGSYQNWPPTTLYLSNNTTTNSGISLYVGSTAYISSNTTIYMSGAVGNSNNNIPLYIGASSIISHNISLFTTGDFIFSSGITLYTPGSIQTWPPITLYTLNVGSGSVSPASLPFYTAGLIHPTSTLYFPLYTSASTAGTNGLYNDTDLYLEGGKLYQSLPLYLGVAAIPYPPSGNMSLFVGTPHITGVYNNSINLYLDNNVSGINSIVKRLFISGLGGLAGGSISTSNLLPLFIDVSGISSSSSNTSKTISLMTESNTKSSGNIPLYIGASSIQSNHLSIYEAGFIFYPSGINFYTTGRTLDFNEPITTYIRGY